MELAQLKKKKGLDMGKRQTAIRNNDVARSLADLDHAEVLISNRDSENVNRSQIVAENKRAIKKGLRL